MASLQASSHKMSTFFSPRNEITESDCAVVNADTFFTEFIVSVADHASKLFQNMFPDSKISAKYGCGRSKSGAVVHFLPKPGSLLHVFFSLAYYSFRGNLPFLIKRGRQIWVEG